MKEACLCGRLDDLENLETVLDREGEQAPRCSGCGHPWTTYANFGRMFNSSRSEKRTGVVRALPGTLVPVASLDASPSVGGTSPEDRAGRACGPAPKNGASSIIFNREPVLDQSCDPIEAAYRAQAELARFDQKKIDRVCEAMVQAAQREARRLRVMVAEETGYGVPVDEEENRSAAEYVWKRFRDVRTVGVIFESKDCVEIAIPRGVVLGIVPSTDPISTTIFEALISIKSRNALVLSAHHSAMRCAAEAVRVLRQAAIREGLPADAIRYATAGQSQEALIKHEKTAVVLTTGGMGSARAGAAKFLTVPASSYWDNNIASCSISPLHLMDIKRVAFESQPVEGVAPHHLGNVTREPRVAA